MYTHPRMPSWMRAKKICDVVLPSCRHGALSDVAYHGRSLCCPATASQVVVIDNGGGACKLGLASQPASVRRAPPHASHACSMLMMMSVQPVPRASARAATAILLAPTCTQST